MKNKIIFIVLVCSFFTLSLHQNVLEFKDKIQYEEITNKREVTFIANYNRLSGKKYLYIYPSNNIAKMNSNKAIVKIFFKQIPNKESANDFNLNYLNSDYSSIEFNAGLFIKLSELKYDTAIIYILSYENFSIKFLYQYEDNINFPPYLEYSNFQLNQFILEKRETEQIKYKIQQDENFYLLILSKTSLRNLVISGTYNKIDINQGNLAYLYPNGYSLFFDKNSFHDDYVYININNKNDKSELLLLGYVHHNENELFPNEIVNGFQLYLEANQNEMDKLLISGKTNLNQFFIYQIYDKKLEIDFLTKDNQRKGTKKITEYNSIFPYKIDFEGRLRFEFGASSKRCSLYFQYLDYSDNIVAQKSLQSLVTGVPKSMIIPDEKSMYHFLPIERDSNNLYFLLRAKTEQQIFISFESCSSYPENCTFSGKGKNAVEAIENIGLWYTLPRNKNKNELNLIYVYCEKECAYDIIISYEQDDPLFLFPENDYTKLISDSGKDIFALPVFESFKDIQIKSLYIDLTIISGQAKITLKNGKDGSILKYDMKKFGNKQRFNISSDIFLNDTNYFKKEIYAIVEQENNYLNTIYNIMYGSGQTSNTKFLSNKIVNIESLKVGIKGKESSNSKIFNFINNENRNLYISISTYLCKSKVLINNTAQYESFSHSYKIPYGSSNFEIYLLNDNSLCNEDFEEEVILYSYYLNQNVLLTENSFIKGNISEKASFIHLFKPIETENIDNSFNIGIERLNENPISYTYEIKRISFNGSDYIKSSDNSSQMINSKTIRYISNKKIKEICGSLKQYEVCSLIITFVPFSTSYSQFSLNLNKNGLYYSKHLIERSLISSINTKSVQYFYIDINENINKYLELIINSYGQDLSYYYQIEKTKKEDDEVLPLKNSFLISSNNHQISIDISECKTFCRLYISISSQDSEGNEFSSLFSISYQFLEENNFINLPINYFTQYTFKDLNEVNYIINPIEADDFTFELYIIKQNEKDNTEVEADISDISGTLKYKLLSSEGKHVLPGKANEIKIKITKNIGNELSTFKFRVTSIGKGNSFNGFIPIKPSYEEKCFKSPCYYLFDEFSLDNEEISAYFYIPEIENSIINIKKLKYNEKFQDNDDYEISSSDRMKKSNWYEITNINKEKNIIIKIINDKVTLCPSYYIPQNNLTLNYGEKRMFTLRKRKIEKIILNIKQPYDPKSKVRINIHSIRGNGIFKFKEEIYPLGLENSYKEDISIIIDDDKLSNIELTAINEKNGKADTDYEYAADFVFTIEYKIDLIDQLLYEINYDKINSYKVYRKQKIDKIFFYLNIAERPTKDINMNIKVYSNSSQYDIKSFFVDNNFIQKKLDDSGIDSGLNMTIESIRTYIQGGNLDKDNLTFAKLEISSDELQKYYKEYPFICIIFTQKEKKNYYVKFDLYPYEMNNTTPLARNQLFVQKIPANNNIYKLFLSKSEIYYRKNVIIDFVYPLLKEYNYSIAHLDIGNNNPKENEDKLISYRRYSFGKEEITLDSIKNITQKNIIFNLFPKADKDIVADSFIFSYKNQIPNEEEDIYYSSTNSFNISGDSKEIKYSIHAPVSKNNGHTILISRVYEFDEIKHLDIYGTNQYIPLYLLFSDIKPIYVSYDVLNINILSNTDTVKHKIKKGGDFYFTAICVLEDNEREIYFGYEGIRKEIEDKNFFEELLDYMKDHIFATIIILIVIIIILGMIINICRSERKVGRLSSVKVEVEGQLMEDKD